MVKHHRVITFIQKYNIGHFQLRGKHTFWKRHITNIHQRTCNTWQRHFEIYDTNFIKSSGILFKLDTIVLISSHVTRLKEYGILNRIAHTFLTWGINFAKLGPTFMKKSLKCSEIDILSVVVEPLLNLNLVWRTGSLFLLIIYFIIPKDFFILYLFLVNNSW